MANTATAVCDWRKSVGIFVPHSPLEIIESCEPISRPSDGLCDLWEQLFAGDTDASHAAGLGSCHPWPADRELREMENTSMENRPAGLKQQGSMMEKIERIQVEGKRHSTPYILCILVGISYRLVSPPHPRGLGSEEGK